MRNALNFGRIIGSAVDQQQQSRWRTIGRWVIGTVCILAALALVYSVYMGYRHGWNWTGIVKHSPYPKRTLWNWLQLLIIPAVLAGGGLWFNRQQQERQREDNLQQQEREREFAERRSQDEALQAYLDGMAQLLADRDRPLHRAQRGDSLSMVARAQTLTVLTRLDGERKGSVVRFLYDSGLIGRLKPVKGSKIPKKVDSIVDLRGADLRGIDLHRAPLNGVKLSGVVLSGVDLSIALLVEADLRGADLSRANVSGAILTGADLGNIEPLASHMGPWGWADPQTATNLKAANLEGAVLWGAVLEGADLSGANLTHAQVIHPRAAPHGILAEFRGWSGIEEGTNLWLWRHAGNLQGATLPSGQKYERWLEERRTKELLKRFGEFQESAK
jgi:uncharacterized protein YjbI with pentapeptide repeats